MDIKRERTAITRNSFSLPVKLALSDGIIDSSRSVFDYGCGKGHDIRLLKKEGIPSFGWDPVHQSGESIKSADVVNLGYVINVIERPSERIETLKKAFELAKHVLVVAVLSDTESNRASRAVPHGDGIITSRGTFQKFYTQSELKDLIKQTLGIEPVSAGLGIVYVFCNETEKQLFLATRVRRTHYEYHQKPLSLEDRFRGAKRVLEKFVRVIEYLGRIPNEDEFEATQELKGQLGSFGRAFNLVRHVVPDNLIKERTEQRVNDLLVYLALSRFQSRPQLGALPKTLQYDMRAFFGGYSKACEQADKLLFLAGKSEAVDRACAESKVGKLLPSDLYIHKEYIDRLAPILRIYVGCAQVLVGEIQEANIIKIHRHTGKVSYLSYEAFEKKAHPELKDVVTVMLRSLEIKKRSYRDSENPPILHRKETFVLSDHPLYEKFRELTLQEEKAGLLDDAAGIGFKQQWENRLFERRYRIGGHSLNRIKDKRGARALAV